MLPLKSYQQQTLTVLQNYLITARYQSVDRAFMDLVRENPALPATVYRHLGESLYDPLYDIPYICMRLPTGGGKTLLAAHSIAVAAGAYLHQEQPLVLWLVPSDAIRRQTLATLRNSQHPNRQAIDASFSGRVFVLDIAEFEQLRPQDLQQRICILVGTLQTLRVNSTEGRRVYAHNEHLEPHFANVRRDHPDLEYIDGVAKQKQIRYSLRNLLALQRPLVIVDEAHNASTKLSVEVMQRIRPACVLEFTATPATNSNIIHTISAVELKQEEMIKLPIILTEHPTWQEAIHHSILTRNRLQMAAEKEADFIHPIVLIQAENKGREATVDLIKRYLIEEERLRPEQIAIATGEQRELEGVNLLDPANKVEYVITIQALKEGWDCPFAYVFCSVANIHSAQAVEQLLGRVLRMPYARRRRQKELNQAYAHVSSASWPQAVGQLRDRLVAMGFDQQEANQSIRPQLPLLPAVELPVAPEEPLFHLTLTTAPDLSDLSEQEQTQIDLKAIETVEASTAYRLQVRGDITTNLIEKLVKAVPKAEQTAVRATLDVQRSQQMQQRSPAQRGATLIIPQLCLWIDGQLEVVTPEHFDAPAGLNLLEHSARLNEQEFSIHVETRSYAFDVNGKRLELRMVREQRELDLDFTQTHWSDLYMSRWVANRLRERFLKDEVLLEFIRRAIEYLVKERRMALVDIVRARYGLEAALRHRIVGIKSATAKQNFQTTLFAQDATVQTSYEYAIRFNPQVSFPPPYYDGIQRFEHHLFLPIPAFDTDDELACATTLEYLAEQGKIKYWVRNPVRQEGSFRLPLAEGYFYPDFIAQLSDDRILIIEFKGDHLVNDPKERQKKNVGEKWEETSNGQGLFVWAVQKDEFGRNVDRQIRAKIG